MIPVAIHYCGGNAGAAHGWFQSAADTNGFYIITPDAGKNCFDSSASRDGDKAAIVKMVDTVVALGGDKTRVFAAGFSSGGCMTNTLIAVYPDVFAGGSALPGYPAGAWPKGDTSCQLCGGSGPGGSDTGQKYADLVKGVFAFSGTRPCSQQWVGNPRKPRQRRHGKRCPERMDADRVQGHRWQCAVRNKYKIWPKTRPDWFWTGW